MYETRIKDINSEIDRILILLLFYKNDEKDEEFFKTQLKYLITERQELLNKKTIKSLNKKSVL